MGDQESIKVGKGVSGGEDWSPRGGDDVDGGRAVSICWPGGWISGCSEDCKVIRSCNIFSTLTSDSMIWSALITPAKELGRYRGLLKFQSNLPDRFLGMRGLPSNHLFVS